MKAAKKRHYRTSIMPLSNAQIFEIRKLKSQGTHCEELSKKFEVGRTTIYNILNRRKKYGIEICNTMS
jgi:transposase